MVGSGHNQSDKKGIRSETQPIDKAEGCTIQLQLPSYLRREMRRRKEGAGDERVHSHIVNSTN